MNCHFEDYKMVLSVNMLKGIFQFNNFAGIGISIMNIK